MTLASRLIALIERAAYAVHSRWFKAGAALPLSAVLLFAAPALLAQTAASEIAADLQQVISAPSMPVNSWARNINGNRMVEVLIVSNSTDPNLTALRSAVIAKGRSVYFRYVSVAALLAILPAH